MSTQFQGLAGNPLVEDCNGNTPCDAAFPTGTYNAALPHTDQLHLSVFWHPNGGGDDYGPVALRGRAHFSCKVNDHTWRCYVHPNPPDHPDCCWAINGAGVYTGTTGYTIENFVSVKCGINDGHTATHIAEMRNMLACVH